MGLGSIFDHHLEPLYDNAALSPTVWPFIFFIPVFIGIFLLQRSHFGERVAVFLRPLVLSGSILTLLAVFRVEASYLSTNFISNSYATLFAETSWLFSLGEPVYASLQAPVHTSIPYGPYGYVLVGTCQHLLGPSIFSSKLAPYLATMGASVFLYLALRTRVEWLSALALTALANALHLPLDPLWLWPRPEPFLLLAVAAGLWAATRREFWGPILVGFLTGFATDIKVYASAFFLMIVVVSWRNHKSWAAWAAAALVAVVTVVVPFTWPTVSLTNYIAMLSKMDTGRRFMDGLAIQVFEWGVLLFILALAPLLVEKRDRAEMQPVIFKNIDLLGALFLSFLMICHPAGMEASGAHELLPFIPVFIYLAGHLWSGADLASKPHVGREMSWSGVSMTLSIVLFISSNALIRSYRDPAFFREMDVTAKGQIEDIRSLIAKTMPCVLLVADGSDETREKSSYRSILVFNGMPIGIGAIPMMDYKSLNFTEPDLGAFVAGLEAKSKLPIYWICPKGAVPFSETSYFLSGQRVFSEKFTNDFTSRFEIAERSTYFDLYKAKPD